MKRAMKFILDLLGQVLLAAGCFGGAILSIKLDWTTNSVIAGAVGFVVVLALYILFAVIVIKEADRSWEPKP